MGIHDTRDHRESGDHEVASIRTIEAGVYADRILAGEVSTAVSASEEELREIVAQGRQAWLDVIERNLRLVRFLARRHHLRSGRPVEELFQEGCLGLMEALRRFDSQRGVRVATVAGPWVTAAMGRVDDHATLTAGEAKRRDRRRRARVASAELSQAFLREPTVGEVAAHVGEAARQVARHLTHEADSVSLQAMAGDVADIPDDRWDPGALPTTTTALDVRRMVAGLPPLHRLVVEARYGLGPRTEQATWRDVARSLGMGVMRTRRLEAEARAMLRADERLSA